MAPTTTVSPTNSPSTYTTSATYLMNSTDSPVAVNVSMNNTFVNVSDGSEPTGIPTRTPISVPIIECDTVPFGCDNGKVLLPYYSVEQGRCVYDPCFTPSPTEKADYGNPARRVGNSLLTIIVMSWLYSFL